MARRRNSPSKRLPRRSLKPRREVARPVGVRIIGGQFRGRKLRYGGDPRVRPMKDRVREAVFNLLGPRVRGKYAIDLFAGTGALALEALSRGAARATLIEQHHPTARVLRENVAALGVESIAEVIVADTLVPARWADRLGDAPWLVFCSPPYALYVEKAGAMLELLGGLLAAAPAGSVLVVEADRRFDFQRLPDPAAWDVRAYPPAVIGIYEKTMDIQNIRRALPFTTKDGSEIRELLAHRNSAIRNQSLAEARLPPGASTSPHHHVKTEEIYYILEGEGQMQVGGEVRAVTAGDAIAIPPGSLHQITNVGREVLKFLCCCAPGYEHEDTVLAE